MVTLFRDWASLLLRLLGYVRPRAMGEIRRAERYQATAYAP